MFKVRGQYIFELLKINLLTFQIASSPIRQEVDDDYEDIYQRLGKGGLIRKSFFNFVHPRKNEPNHCLSSYLFNLKKKKSKDSDFVRFFLDWTKLKIPSDINPPL